MSEQVEQGLRLLWVDDDAPGAFPREQRFVSKKGWQLTWAVSQEAALKTLASEPFDALILDQQLPYGGDSSRLDNSGKRLTWSGCMILHWLRDNHLSMEQAPEHVTQHLRSIEQKYRPYISNTEGSDSSDPVVFDNRYIPVMVFSAHYRPEVTDAMRNADAVDKNLSIHTKPIDLEVLRQFLEQARQKKIEP